MIDTAFLIEKHGVIISKMPIGNCGICKWGTKEMYYEVMHITWAEDKIIRIYGIFDLPEELLAKVRIEKEIFNPYYTNNTCKTFLVDSFVSFENRWTQKEVVSHE